MAAGAQSVTTHRAPAAVGACALLAETLVDAIATGEKVSVLRPRSAAEPSVAAVAAGSWPEVPGQAAMSWIRLKPHCGVSTGAPDFFDAVLLAANLADDADTGGRHRASCGALWGRLDRLVWRDEHRERGRRPLALRNEKT